MVIKNIPLNVNKRLNMLSCNEEVFEQSKPKYQEALRASGYTHELKYEKVNIHDLNKKPGVKNGLVNGLSVILDVEAYEYSSNKPSTGFMVALSDAAGRAMISQQGTS